MKERDMLTTILVSAAALLLALVAASLFDCENATSDSGLRGQMLW